MLFNNYKFTLCYFIAVIIIPLNGFSEDKTDRNLFPFSSDQLIEIVKSPEHYYAITRKKGIFVSFDKGLSWYSRNQGLSKRYVYPFQEDKEYQFITSYSIDQKNSKRIAITTADELFLSENSGAYWKKIPTKKPIGKYSYFTSIALSSHNKNKLVIGTSFDGMYETNDQGETWTDLSYRLDHLSRGAGFYEEISSITYHPDQNQSISILAGFGKGLFHTENIYGNSDWEKIPLPGLDIRGIKYSLNNSTWQLEAYNSKTNWKLTTKDTWIKLNEAEEIIQNNNTSKFSLEAANRYGIYVNEKTASKSLSTLLPFLKSNGLNAIIVDFKDDYGKLTYDSKLPFAKTIGAIKRTINLNELIEIADDHGIYVIGRIVVFKDPIMYEWDNNRFAIWNGTTDSPWGNFIPISEADNSQNIKKDNNSSIKKYKLLEHWTDPFAQEIWDYNVSVAEEIASRGVDEIQFDYIRFPSDGPISEANYRHQLRNMRRTDAIESFVALSRERLDVPISTDLFGFNSWYRMGNWIGQNIEILSEYVDVICPMFYPSHFPIDFLSNRDYLERAYNIYNIGVSRAISLVDNKSYIRPYIQAFLINDELDMSEREYKEYLEQQLKGSIMARASGFTLWNASNRYYMIKKDLTQYTQMNSN